MNTDLRMPLLGTAAWAGSLLATGLAPGRVALAFVGLAAVAGVMVTSPARADRLDLRGHGRGRRRGRGRGRGRRPDGATRSGRGGGPAAGVAVLTGTVAGDPRLVEGRFGPQVLVPVSVGRHQPVLVFGDDDWRRLAMGERVRFTGRLGPADDGDVAALVTPRGPPEVLARAGVGWRATEALRASIRESVAHRPTSQRALVPALVDGDDAGMPPGLTEDFRTTGLTHLTAVSGTNLTLVVGFLLVVARWAGVRGRWLAVVGAAGIVGFVLLARTEPSVLRAAAMGTVALVGLGRGGWHRGVRGLGVAVVGLLLLDPGLGRTAGFALSVLATAGILLVAPAWRDALARWLPRWLAEAVAVPAAAQLACTPLVAAISGQVSLVAVAANLLVAPVVGPATVLGLLARPGRSGVRDRRPPHRHPGRLVRGVDRRRRRARRRDAGRGSRLGHDRVVPGAAGRRDRGRAAGPGRSCCATAPWAPRPASPCWRSRCWGRRLPAGHPTAGSSPPATSARATRWCSGRDRARPSWSTPAPTHGWSRAACAGWASSVCRCSC